MICHKHHQDSMTHNCLASVRGFTRTDIGIISPARNYYIGIKNVLIPIPIMEYPVQALKIKK